MAPLSVDPEAMYAAGSGIGAVGEALAAALGPLTAGFGINSGQDAAGLVFGLGYQNAAESLLNGAAAGIFACRYVGAKVQLCASNYSRADAASNVHGSGHVLPAPVQPQEFPAPGRPGAMGPGVAQPLLWAVVEALVDDVWPNGNGVGMQAAAGCWRGFGAALRGVGEALNGPKSTIAAQQVPEAELVQQCISKLGAKLGDLAGQCDALANALDGFAIEVDKAQNNIRDLLRRLGSLGDLGHDVVLIFEGDAVDELEKIVRDINAVLDNMKREAKAREQVIKTGMQIIDGLVGEMKSYVRGQLVQFLGETVGNFLANRFDFTADAGEGIFKSAVGLAELQDQLDPSRFVFDPQGAAASWAALDQTAVKSIPAYALFDPEGALKNDLGLAKGLTHWDDLTSGRPGLAVGEFIFDGATFAVGGGAIKAGSEGAEAAAAGAKATEGVADGEKVAQGAVGAVGELNGVGGPLADIGKTGGDITKGLQNLGDDLPKGDLPPSGSPVNLPPGKLPEAPVESAPRPSEGAPGAPHGPADAGPPPRGVGERPGPAVDPHDPAPVGGPREPVASPIAGSPVASAAAAAAERAPSTMPKLIDHSPTQLPVPETRSPVEPAPAATHAAQPAPPSPPSAPVAAAPHLSSPSGHPSDMPAAGGSVHGPNDALPHGGHPYEKSPHSGEPDGSGDGKPDQRADDPHGRDGEHHGDSHEGPPHVADKPVAGQDYPFPPDQALQILSDPHAEIARLASGKVPSHILENYDPLAGRTPDEFANEFTVRDSAGKLKWDWDNQAPHDGFAGTPTETDRIPAGIHLDRVGPNGGAFMSPEGEPLARRATPPGLASQYHTMTGSGEPVPDNWVVKHGPAKAAFGQPGGAEQWVVIDRLSGHPVPVAQLDLAGVITDLTP
ncbi:glycohydrolase toxin TNT-related protein [Mycobacterium sp. 4858]|uniref:glycohydrolase toxin TNT-related protein n=1 Tax=Mycobacterium sp. 4858 TaxID=2057185 RepID=UPI000C83B268|nr:glycohydrolase toxin TNT-related protein [Mycobacterium sp. 4858]